MVLKYLIIAAVIAYLLGNISPSTIQAKMRGLDIKKEGSGNAGTTNTLRVLGKKAALITLVIDIGKGVAAVLIGNAMVGPTGAFVSALCVLLGHVFPVLLKFKGGKGVATAFGAILVLNWKLGLLLLAIVVLAVLGTRYVSLGSVVAAVSFPFLCYWLEPGFVVYGTIMALIVLFKHRSNIKRLFAGEENKISFSSKKRGD